MEVSLIGRNLWDEVKGYEQLRRLGIEKINKNWSLKKKKKYIFIKTGGKKGQDISVEMKGRTKGEINVNYNPSQMQRKRDINQRRRNTDRNWVGVGRRLLMTKE
jgi:hypothetical protein